MANGKQVDFLVAGMIDDSGNVLASGKVYTYESGTTTDKTCWTDAAKTTPATNPIILDTMGRATIYADGNYTFLIKDSSDVTISTLDNLYFNIPSTSSDTVRAITATDSIVSSDKILLVGTASGNVTLSITPLASASTGVSFIIQKTTSDANTVIIDPAGSETINGSATKTLTKQFEYMEIASDGTNWVVTSGIAPSSPIVTPNIFTPTITSAVLNTGVSGTAFLDEDNMASNSATKLASQQSIKAYVDAHGVVQRAYNNVDAKATGTTLIPFDDTAPPQITEGDEYMTQAITPTNASNILVIECEVAVWSYTANTTVTFALFQDATANALAMSAQYVDNTNQAKTARLKHTMVAGTTSATTFRLRVGGASGGTFTFNGVNNTSYGGGILASSMTVTEYKV